MAGDPPLPLESVITTADLDRRPSRAPDYEAENRVLTALMDAMANATGSAGADAVLQKLVENALILCRADSAGVSLLETEAGREVFRWRAAAGTWAKFLGGSTPREQSPGGAVLDRNAPLLMEHPERHYEHPEGAPPLAEVLLIPFHSGARPIGTVWVIAHDQTGRFDAEDRRLMMALSRFAAAAYQLLARQAAEGIERTHAEEAPEEADRPAGPPKAEEPAAKSPAPCRVLVVDDNQDGASSLGAMLDLLGYEIRTAFDGLQGLEVAAAFRPDVALLDIGMPGMNGYELARSIRGEPWGRDAVLIAVTGWGQMEDRQRTTAAGFDDHLVKPVDPIALARLLTSLATARGRTAPS